MLRSFFSIIGLGDIFIKVNISDFAQSDNTLSAITSLSAHETYAKVVSTKTLGEQEILQRSHIF